MKKIIAVGIVALMAMAFAAAQQTTGIALGVRGIFSVSAGTTYEKDFRSLWKTTITQAYGSSAYVGDVSSKSRGGGGFTFFAKYPLGKRLGAQVEVGYVYNVTGFKFEFSKNYDGSAYHVKKDISYSTFNVPLLLTFDIIQTSHFLLTPAVGLQVAFPIGKTGDWAELPINTRVLVGAVVGASMTIKFGQKVGMVIDGRYNIGFNALKADGVKIFTPRGLQISGGLQIMFR